MCGLAGILGAPTTANREALRRMSAAMVHRGPDGEGYWEGEADTQAWAPMLAHRRLAILDLSPAGAQPMVDPVSGDVVILNGEIYNHQALRTSLGDKAAELESSGDTATMLRLLSARGVEALAELRGMFALAHWDRRARRLTLARDPAGIKPLYILRNRGWGGDWALAFASEVRALLASGLLPDPRLDPVAVRSVIWNGFVVSPNTIVEGIESASPGEAVTLDVRGVEQARWRFWERPAAGAGKPADEAEVAGALAESVKLHLASDVPLGVFLSGGVDSSAVANLAHRATGRVRTFTLAFEEARHNEGVFARRVAEAIGTEHQEVLLTQQHFIDSLEPALESLDQPTFDGINSFVMSRAVRDAGFKVALVGTGGDELFGGYTAFRDLPALAQWSRRTAWVPRGLRVTAARVLAGIKNPAQGRVPPQTRWAKLPDMVSRGEDLIGLYQLAYGLFLPDFQRCLVDAARLPGELTDGLPAGTHESLRREIEGREPHEAVSVLEQRLFLGERLLPDTDAASMAASIEIRLPLVDSALLAAVERLPTRERFEPVRSKAMLRRIGLGGLDPALFDRPKQGFELPYEQWLKGALGGAVGDVLEDAGKVGAVGLAPGQVATLWQAFREGAPGLYWTRLWALFVLVRWCHAHHVSVAA
ncbi:MAG: asparagine synthase (glutamine-hydrolyzing) [Gammaproteobacteria bacterium]|nr:asparagine synthase (glutamine-hydrolyzing) [Gammaproteobacteria bacterium]